MATPVLSSLTGTFIHNASMTLSGSNFDTKATAAPRIWDNCSHGQSLATRWDGGWPSANPTYNADYRSVQRGIALPHSRGTKYLCGAHYDTLSAEAGYAVMVWKNRTFSEGARMLASWYQRNDDNWTFDLGAPVDNNLKHFDYSVGVEPYNPENWYTEWYADVGGNVGPMNNSYTNVYHINDDNSSITGGGAFGSANYTNPFSGVWTKVEMAIIYSATSGAVVIAENGTTIFSYSGPTDLMTGTARNESIGGYARSQGSTNNWRYFSDLYLDDCFNSVILGNASTKAACTVLEYQIPTAWSSTSISFTANLGSFGNTDTAWLYVSNSTATVNSNGFAVTLGGAVGDSTPGQSIVPSSSPKYGRLQRIPI